MLQYLFNITTLNDNNNQIKSNNKEVACLFARRAKFLTKERKVCVCEREGEEERENVS